MTLSAPPLVRSFASFTSPASHGREGGAAREARDAAAVGAGRVGA